MKKCPYCGKEYPDDATVCVIDTETLVEYSPKLPEPKKQELYFVFPQYQWSAKDAWKCLGVIFFLMFVTGLMLAVIILAKGMTFSAYQNNVCGDFFKNVFSYTIYLLPTIYFARTRTFTTFINGFGLDCGVTKKAWFGIIMALILRFHGHLYGWGKISTPEIISFQNTPGFERLLFLVPLLLFAPFIEEMINRGFLYKAFRGSYSIEVSIALMVIWTIITHLGYCFHSPSTTVILSILTIVQCLLREKSGSLWDCIICHFVFNASLVFIAVLQR